MATIFSSGLTIKVYDKTGDLAEDFPHDHSIQNVEISAVMIQFVEDSAVFNHTETPSFWKTKRVTVEMISKAIGEVGATRKT